nr:HNH endonuclease [Planktothrix sp. FACHB-1355]
MLNGEKIHTHHLTKVTDGGTDDIDNLIHLHQICHQKVHGTK